MVRTQRTPTAPRAHCSAVPPNYYILRIIRSLFSFASYHLPGVTVGVGAGTGVGWGVAESVVVIGGDRSVRSRAEQKSQGKNRERKNRMGR